MKPIIAIVLSITTVIFSCFAGLLGGVIGVSFGGKSIEQIASEITSDVRVTNEENAIIEVAEMASPSVVSIVITKDLPVYEEYYYDYFGFDIPGRRQTGTEETEIGAGSGFVISSDGLIVTNKHVVEDSEASYTVIFNDETKVEAKVLAKDTLLDIAFLKVEGVELTPLKLGSSENLKVGQTVVAIGNALGEFSNTVSSGIISGLKRDILAGDASGNNFEALDNVIQTDASINPGNSGGPLLDISGNVIGVNVAVADAENIGFAIPIDTVKDLINRLNEKGEIVRPTLGVRYVLIDKNLQEENDLTVDYGALVIRGNKVSEVAVIPGSPADKAGILENDIILEVEDTKINTNNPLISVIQQYNIGDTLTLKVLSKGSEKSIDVTL